MTLKTLNKCSWEDIEVGEVFAHDGCWQIHYKDSLKSSIPLAFDYEIRTSSQMEYAYVSNFLGSHPNFGLYKLPLSVQRLWRCDYD